MSTSTIVSIVITVINVQIIVFNMLLCTYNDRKRRLILREIEEERKKEKEEAEELKALAIKAMEDDLELRLLFKEGQK